MDSQLMCTTGDWQTLYNAVISRRIVSQALEDRLGVFAVSSHTIQSKFGRDYENRPVAGNLVWKSSLDSRNILFLDGTVHDLPLKLFRRISVLRDEHDTTRQSIQSMTGHRVECVVSLPPYDFDQGVVIVSTSRMHRNASGFVDDHKILALMNDANRFSGDGRLMPMHCVANDVSIAHYMINLSDQSIVDLYCTTLYSFFLLAVSQAVTRSLPRT